MASRFRISADAIYPSVSPSRPLVLGVLLAALLGCSSPRDAALVEFERWHESARAQAKAGMLAWSELYKQSFDRLTDLPPSMHQDTQLENTVMLLSTARKYEAHEIDAQQFAEAREHIETQLQARLR